MSTLASHPSTALAVPDDGVELAALEAAYLGYAYARDKGLPKPFRLTVVGGHIEAALPLPDGHVDFYAVDGRGVYGADVKDGGAG